jgi:hypothetical protein
MTQYFCRVLIFTVVLAAACSAQSDGPSLGDVARKSRTHAKPVVFFDDGNTQRTAAADDSAPALDSAKLPRTGQTDTAKTQAATKGDGKTSASAAGNQADKLKKQLESLKQQQSVWSKSAKDYEDKLANETSDFRRQVDEEALQNDKQNVQFYQQKINQVETELSKAQETSQTTGGDQPNHTFAGGHGNQP